MVRQSVVVSNMCLNHLPYVLIQPDYGMVGSTSQIIFVMQSEEMETPSTVLPAWVTVETLSQRLKQQTGSICWFGCRGEAEPAGGEP